MVGDQRPDVLCIKGMCTVLVEGPESTIHRPSFYLGYHSTRTGIVFGSKNSMGPCLQCPGDNIGKAAAAIKERYDAKGGASLGHMSCF